MYVDGTDENADEIKRKYKKELARSVFMKNLDWEAFDKAFLKMQEDSTSEELIKKIKQDSSGGSEEEPADESGGSGSFEF